MEFCRKRKLILKKRCMLPICPAKMWNCHQVKPNGAGKYKLTGSQSCCFTLDYAVTLTHSTDHQQLPKQQQQVCHLVQHHNPARSEQRLNLTPKFKQLYSQSGETDRVSFQFLYYGKKINKQQKTRPTNLKTFLMSSLKAFLAETQKFFP